MSIVLRPDQLEAVENLREALKSHQSVLLQAATGFGKTIVAAYIAQSAFQKRRRVIFGVHRRELARQTALTFDRFGIPYGFIAAGMDPNPFALVQIASADTLRRRPQLMGCDLLVPDEAHLWGSETRADIIDAVRQDGAHIVPLTATPERLDGKPMRLIADHMVCGPSVRWLIERGHLSRYVPYAAARPDLTKLARQAGDFAVGALTERFDKPSIIGDAVEMYRRYAFKLRMVGYCFSREHGKHMRDTFNANGIPAGYIDGETPDEERRKLIWQFAKRVIWVLFNVQLLREGFDLSAQVGEDVPIEAVGLYAPTESLPLAMQEMGRAMRKKDIAAPILDHAGIMIKRDGSFNHGFPDDERTWSLDGKSVRASNGEAAIPTCVCHECLAIYRPAAKCPYCGAAREIEGRQVEQVDGELAELDIEKIRLHNIEMARKKEFAKREEQAARTVADLVRIAKERNYKLPGYVMHKMKARGQKVNLTEVYKEMRK